MKNIALIEEINRNIKSLDISRLNDILDYVRFIKYREDIDPTFEILDSKNFIEKIEQGLKEKAAGDLVSWDEVR